MDILNFLIALCFTISVANVIIDLVMVKFILKNVVVEGGIIVKVSETQPLLRREESLKERLIKLKFFDTLVKDIAADLHDGYVSLAVPKDSYTVASTYVYYGTICGSVSVVTALILTFLFNNVLLLSFGIIGFLVVLYPYLDMFLMKREKDEGVSNELVFFTFLTYIFQESGSNIGRLIEETVSRLKGMFMWMWRECSAMLRERLTLAKDIPSCLLSRYDMTKSLTYKRFLSGYAYIYAEGGDLVTFLREQLNVMMDDFRAKVRGYIGFAGTISEIVLLLTVLVPTMIIGLSIMAPSLGAMFGVFGVCIIVFATFMLGVMVRREQPKFGTGDILSKISIIEIVVPMLAGIISALFFMRAWVGVVVGATVFALMYGRRGSAEMKWVRSMEEVLPVFVRDIASFRVAGKTVAQAIKTVYEEKRYNEAFRRVLGESIVGMERTGRISVRTGVWIVDFVFASLDYISEFGGGRPALLNALANFIENIQMEKSRVREETKTSALVAYTSPVFFTILLSILFALASLLTSIPSPSSIGTPGVYAPFPEMKITELLKEAMYMMAAVASVLSTLLASYIRKYNLKEVLSLAFVMIELTACVLLVDPISSLVIKMMGVPV